MMKMTCLQTCRLKVCSCIAGRRRFASLWLRLLLMEYRSTLATSDVLYDIAQRSTKMMVTFKMHAQQVFLYNSVLWINIIGTES